MSTIEVDGIGLFLDRYKTDSLIDIRFLDIRFNVRSPNSARLDK